MFGKPQPLLPCLSSMQSREGGVLLVTSRSSIGIQMDSAPPS
nr:unnamed protein product [Callosobruchus chinensis]